MKKQTRDVVFVGLFSAVAYVLYLFPKFSLLPGFPWLEVDFSDVASLYASMAISPAAGLAVVFVKNLLHLAVTHTGAVGELSNFLIGSSFVVSAGLIYRRLKTEKIAVRAILAWLCALPIQLAVSAAVNYFIMVPLYMGPSFDGVAYLTAGVLPFNLVKCLLVGAAFTVVYRFTVKQFTIYFHK